MTCLGETDIAILCGGRGTRLGFQDKPKCLAPVLGKPILDHIVAKLEKHGGRRLVFIAGFLSAQILDWSTKHPSKDWAILNDRFLEGTAAAIRHSRDYYRSDPVLVVNGDTLLTADLCEALRHHNNHWATLIYGTSEDEEFCHTGASLISQRALDELCAAQLGGTLEAFLDLRAQRLGDGHFHDIGTPERLENAAFFARSLNL